MTDATTAAPQPTSPPSGKTPRKAALSSWVGSALEYYDFAVYGTAAALVLNHLFFPADTSPGAAILFSMATVGVAYVVRPLGALIMGPLGDRMGRQFVLMLTLFLMGGATFAVGLLPTYEQAGPAGADPADPVPRHPGPVGRRRAGQRDLRLARARR